MAQLGAPYFRSVTKRERLVNLSLVFQMAASRCRASRLLHRTFGLERLLDVGKDVVVVRRACCSKVTIDRQ
jgi:hypothetical protein